MKRVSGGRAKGVERGVAKKVRVVKIDYRAAGVGKTNSNGKGGGSLNSSPISIGNGAWDIKEILGDADIYEDGSAMFEVPAMTSLYWQVLDSKGRVIQTARTWDTIQPGEQKGCVGCHTPLDETLSQAQMGSAIAMKRGPQKLTPFYGPSRGFSFQREIQPILDKKCVSCHDGKKKKVMDLRGIPTKRVAWNKRAWTQSYLNLLEAEEHKTREGSFKGIPEEGLVNWISKMSEPTALPPYSGGSVKSPLMVLLEKGHEKVKLTDEEYHKFAAWIDLLVPFSGEYREGHHWKEEEMTYYGYFEAKRREQYREEQWNISNYLRSLNGQCRSTPRTLRPLSPPDSDVSGRRTSSQSLKPKQWISRAISCTARTVLSST